jgi:hypothetical protein
MVLILIAEAHETWCEVWTIIDWILCSMATFVKSYLSIVPVHKIGAMHTSSTRNKHQRIKNLFLNGTYTNCLGSWNLVRGLNHNWLNPLQHGYICKTHLSIPEHNIGAMHTSSTRNKHPRIKNQPHQIPIANNTTTKPICCVVPKLRMMWTIDSSLMDQTSKYL